MLSRLRKLILQKIFLMAVVPGVILLTTVYFFLFGQRYVSTDNAYIKADKVAIASEVSGRIVKINAENNEEVEKGKLLFEIDPKPYQFAVYKAEANLNMVKNEIEAIKANYNQAVATLEFAKKNMRYWEKEHKRYKSLINTDSVSQSKLDEVYNHYNSAIKDRDSAKEEVTATLAKLSGDISLPVEQQPKYLEAKAHLENAQLNLKWTKVFAPFDGKTVNLLLETGQYVKAGTPLFSMVKTDSSWVEANFKETDLTYVRPGDQAMIKIDAYPDEEWEAVVGSISGATGSELSILPPQNSSGNWVKVVQRIMVKLKFKHHEQKVPLAAGMSCNVTIDTGHTRIDRWLDPTKK